MNAPDGMPKGDLTCLPSGSRRMKMRARSSSANGFVAGGIASAMTAMFAVFAVMAIVATVAASAYAAPEFEVDLSHPAVLVPGGSGAVQIIVVNTGDAAIPTGR